MSDLIDRRVLFAQLRDAENRAFNGYYNGLIQAHRLIADMPSAQLEPLTDKEQRIFLAAMGREEEVCKQVDCREPYEDSLVRTCHDITRKVKGALWTI